jgi:hypothetical protein
MEWIEAEQDKKNEQSRITKLAGELAILRRDEEQRKAIALGEMYGAFARSGTAIVPSHGIKITNMAKAMVFLCYKLSYIDWKTEQELLKVLDNRLDRFHKQEQEEKNNES